MTRRCCRPDGYLPADTEAVLAHLATIIDVPEGARVSPGRDGIRWHLTVGSGQPTGIASRYTLHQLAQAARGGGLTVSEELSLRMVKPR